MRCLQWNAPSPFAGLFGIALALSSRSLQAAEREPESERAPRTNVLGVSLAYQVPINIDKDFAGGAGIFYTREYFVSPRAALGIHSAVRMFPAAPFHVALGYGLTIKHYLGSFGATPSSGLYILYGLLLQMNWVSGLDGSATGHDTKMAVGYDRSSVGISPVFELAYHLTQVRSFDQPTVWWPYIDLGVGVRF